MNEYGNYQSQQLKMNSLNKKNVEKNENKNEKLKKAVTYTLGTLAGVSLASLVAYGIINKGQSKKVVDKAKENVQKAASKSVKPVVSDDRKKIFKVLDLINNKKDIKVSDLKVTAQLVEAKIGLTSGQEQIIYTNYFKFLNKLLENAKGKDKLQNDDYKELAKEYKVDEIRNSIKTIVFESYKAKKLNEIDDYLGKDNIKNFNVIKGEKKIVIQYSINKKNKKTIDKAVDLPENVVKLTDKIYVLYSDNKIDDGTKLYIEYDKKYYEVDAKILKDLTKDSTSKEEIKDLKNIKSFSGATISEPLEDSEEVLVKGVKDNKDKECLVKVSVLDAKTILKFLDDVGDKSQFDKLVQYVDNKKLGEVFIEDINKSTNKIINKDDKLTDKGNKIIDVLNEKINKIDTTSDTTEDEKVKQKVDIIKDFISSLQLDKSQNEQEKKVIVNALFAKTNNYSLVAQIFTQDDSNLLVKNDTGDLTDAGKFIVNSMIENGCSLKDLSKIAKVNNKIKYEDKDKGIEFKDGNLNVDLVKYTWKYIASLNKNTGDELDYEYVKSLQDVLKEEEINNYLEFDDTNKKFKLKAKIETETDLSNIAKDKAKGLSLYQDGEDKFASAIASLYDNDSLDLVKEYLEDTKTSKDSLKDYMKIIAKACNEGSDQFIVDNSLTNEGIDVIKSLGRRLAKDNNLDYIRDFIRLLDFSSDDKKLQSTNFVNYLLDEINTITSLTNKDSGDLTDDFQKILRILAVQKFNIDDESKILLAKLPLFIKKFSKPGQTFCKVDGQNYTLKEYNKNYYIYKSDKKS